MPDRPALAALPTTADMVAMSHAERLTLLAKLDALADTVAEARGALRALLHAPPAPASLLDAKEVARRLNMSVDWVREHGGALDIEVWLATDPDKPAVRYDPIKVEALRQRRRPAAEQSPVAARLVQRLK
jgi:hypothetical protein